MKNYAKNILISGYYGFHNIGDELVLQEIIKGLREQDSSLNITVLSADPEYTRETYAVKAENRWSLYQIFKSICKADVLISGGGSLLQDKTSKNGILYYLGIILLARLFAKKIIILSQGIGPISLKRNIYFVKKTLALADYISVRDIESLNILKEIGINKDIVFTGDPVFLIEKSSEDIIKVLWKEVGLKREKKLILVSFRPWENIQNVVAETKEFLSEFDRDKYQIRYVAFHKGEDEEILSNIIPQEEKLNIQLSPEKMSQLIGSSCLVIGMRLHSLILAAAQKVPFISISYDPKVDSLDREIYNSQINITTENISVNLIEEKYNEIKGINYNVEVIKKRAKGPFKYFNSL